MTNQFRRLGLGIGATTIVAVTILAASSAYLDAQDTSPATGRRAGPGGPGPGGPGGFGPGGRGGPGGLGRFGGRGAPGGPMGPGVVGLPLDRLGLTDAQRDLVRTIVQSHETELAPLRDREFTAREALQSVVMADIVNEGAIRARSAEVASVEADMAVANARIRAEVFAQLTPEQQATARDMPARPGNRRPPPPPQ